MLLASWIISFLLIIGFGIYAGTQITKSNQWNGSDRSMGIFSVPILKFSKLRSDWAPQYLSAGTLISPIESRSKRHSSFFAMLFPSLSPDICIIP